MKRFALLLPLLILGLTAASMTGCSAEQLASFGKDHSTIAAAASQPAAKVEIILEKADPVVEKVGAGATTVQNGANAAGSLGIPYAGWVGIAAGVVASLAGAYKAARNGNLASAAQNAFTTVTNAWHAEGTPDVSPAMQTALNTVALTAPSVTLPIYPPNKAA